MSCMNCDENGDENKKHKRDIKAYLKNVTNRVFFAFVRNGPEIKIGSLLTGELHKKNLTNVPPRSKNMYLRTLAGRPADQNIQTPKSKRGVYPLVRRTVSTTTPPPTLIHSRAGRQAGKQASEQASKESKQSKQA